MLLLLLRPPDVAFSSHYTCLTLAILHFGLSYDTLTFVGYWFCIIGVVLWRFLGSGVIAWEEDARGVVRLSALLGAWLVHHETNVSLSQQLDKLEHEKHDLQRKLKAAQEGGAAAAQKVCASLRFRCLAGSMPAIVYSSWNIGGFWKTFGLPIEMFRVGHVFVDVCSFVPGVPWCPLFIVRHESGR